MRLNPNLLRDALYWAFILLGYCVFALTLAHGQISNPSVLYVGSAPTGSCSSAPPLQVLTTNGVIYSCNNGTWGATGGGGTGTVTSVTFTGDGTILSSTPSSAVTTSGTLTATLANTPTGTGGVVLATSPTLVTPALGTPASGVITNLTGTCTACTATTATNLGGGAVGSVPYQTAAGATSFLAGNTTTTPNFYTSTGSGAAALAPLLTGSTGSGAVVLQGTPQINTLNIGGGDVSLSRPTGAVGEITVTTWLMNSTNACVGSNSTAASNALCLASSGNLTEQNQTAATSGANQSGPTLSSGGNYWTGAASAVDKWTLQDVLGSGTNPTSTWTAVHSGSTGASAVSFPNLIAGSYQQIAASATGGTCAMSTGTSCTITLGHTYTTPVCIATQQSATLTGGAVGCTVSGTTVTITSAVANSETWGAFVFGNPN